MAGSRSVRIGDNSYLLISTPTFEIVCKCCPWRIRDIAANAGAGLVSYIIFVHAWSGCDTTSATFGQGKTGLLKKLKESPDIQHISSLMIDSTASTEEIGVAGIRLFVHLYGAKQTDSLNNFRYMKLVEMTSCGKKVKPERLPPTERAEHLRVHQKLW